MLLPSSKLSKVGGRREEPKHHFTSFKTFSLRDGKELSEEFSEECLGRHSGLKGAQQPDPLEIVWVEALISQVHRHNRCFFGGAGIPLSRLEAAYSSPLHNSRSTGLLHSESASPMAVGTKGEDTFPLGDRRGASK